MAKLINETTEAQQAQAILVSKMAAAKKKITSLENGIIEASAKEGLSAKEYAEFMDSQFPAAQTPMAWCDVKKSHKSEFGQFVWASRCRITDALDAKNHPNSAQVWKRAKEQSIYFEAKEKTPSEKTDPEKLELLTAQAKANPEADVEYIAIRLAEIDSYLGNGEGGEVKK